MKRLGKFFRLCWAEQCLLAKAALLLGAIRVALWLVSFQTLRRHLERAGQAHSRLQSASSFSPERIAWALAAAGRYVPGTRSCLVQALAAQMLLEREGHPASLHIGVARNNASRLDAHAWVESQGKVVVGGAELERYTRLLAS